MTPRSLVESRSLIEMPFSDSVRERAGAEPIEMWPHLFSKSTNVVLNSDNGFRLVIKGVIFVR